MGNSNLVAHWAALKSFVPEPCPASSSDPGSFTSTTTFQRYTVTCVRNSESQHYEARDGNDDRYDMRVFHVEDFEEVKRITTYLELLKEQKHQLQAPQILDIIVEVTYSYSWSVVVITPPTDFISLEAWLLYLNSLPPSLNPAFALEDVLQCFISLLSYIDITHQHGFLLNRIHPQSLHLVKTSTDVELRFDYLQPECLAAAKHPRKPIAIPPEGDSSSAAKDVWDLGATLLTILQGRETIPDLTAESIRTLRLPFIVKEYLATLLHPVALRPNPAAVLAEKNLTVLKQVLSGEAVERPKLGQLPAIVCGLSFTQVGLRSKVATLLLDLIAMHPSVTTEDLLNDIDFVGFMQVIDALNLAESHSYISPMFALLSGVFGRPNSSLAFKRSGLIKFVKWAMSAFPIADRRFLGYLPQLLTFARNVASSTVFEVLSASDLFLTLSEDKSAAAVSFMMQTCHRYGSYSLVIIPALAEKQFISKLSALELLKKVPLHIHEFGKYDEVNHMLTSLMQGSGELVEKFEKVTDFLVFSLQQMRLLSFLSLKGMCLSTPMQESALSDLTFEHGFFCQDCSRQLCFSCLKSHLSHSYVYKRHIQCREALTDNIVPLFKEIARGFVESPILVDMATGKQVPPGMSLKGPGLYEATIRDVVERRENEELKFYIEMMVETGGDFDEFVVSVRGERDVLRYSGQTGEIECGETKGLGPPAEANDVIGLGVTTDSRAFLTFNGLIHPLIAVSPDFSVDCTLALTLDSDSTILILRRKELLFQPNLSTLSLMSVLSSFEKAKFSKEFWISYKKTRIRAKKEIQKSTKGRRSITAGKLFLSVQTKASHDLTSTKKCKSCAVF